MFDNGKNNFTFTIGSLIVGFIAFGYLGYGLHLQTLNTGWAENINGEWKLKATGYDVYTYAWKSVAVGGVAGALIGYLIGIPIGRLATKRDLTKWRDELVKVSAALGNEHENMKKEKRVSEHTYQVGKAKMREAEIHIKETDKKVALAMKQVEKMKNELKGARARAYRKIKQLKRYEGDGL